MWPQDFYLGFQGSPHFDYIGGAESNGATIPFQGLFEQRGRVDLYREVVSLRSANTKLQQKLDSLLDHLGLEVVKTDPEPAMTIIKKKGGK